MERERNIEVGIVKAQSLRVIFHSAFVSDGKSFVDEQTFTLMDAGRSFMPAERDGSFTLSDVTIGIGFHWERHESQTFRGGLRLIEEDGMLRAVNIVDVETYLCSVISSEMSADASPELLKAHAVISRSWAVRMKDKERRHGTFLKEHLGEASIIRWYDNEAHAGFDVCADDHCQRYQGVGRQTNPNALRAVEQTRGLVLTWGGEVCDARFSKCCGGMTEEFETCWEPVHHPYLVAREDPFCGRASDEVLSQVLNTYDQETRNFYSWEVAYTVDELSELICRKSGIDFGRIQDLVAVERGRSKRIQLLKVVGEKCTVTVGKELEIRKWLSETHLYSSAFEIVKSADAFILRGQGWGHGVGLCQIGAAVMADQGFNYREILEFYYPGAELKMI